MIGEGDPSDDPRLAALHSLRILDTPSEPAFDRIVNLTRRVFGVPIVLVSLIERERQWFKARCGLDVAETPRSVSFCSHAIRTPDRPFVITDATRDARFADNPLVTGAPHIRFYAGAVIRAPNGVPVGTVCIIAPVPRGPLDAEEEDNLVDIAELASDELRLREARLQLEARLHELDEANGMLRQAIETDRRELRLAAESQRRILPPSPRLSPGVRAAGMLLPSREVSGDTFGYGGLDPSRSFFWMADVSGHGVAAALLAGSLSRIITGELLYDSVNAAARSPATVLARLNDRMALWDNGDMYFTMAYGHRDAETGSITLAVAGHPPPLVLLPDGAIVAIEASGTPIGMFDRVSANDVSLVLPPSSRILVYSDGLIDAANAHGESFGEQGVREWMTNSRELSAEAALGVLQRKVLAWVPGSLVDDASAILLDLE